MSPLSYFRIYRGALWILGEYCSTKEDIQSVMTEVRRSLGEVCLSLIVRIECNIMPPYSSDLVENVAKI